MSFLRLVLSAWLSGVYSTLFIVSLVYFLNPNLHLKLSTVIRFLPLMVVLSVPMALGWPSLYRFIRVFARRRLRVRWYGFKYLFGFASANLVLISGLYWFNDNLLESLIAPQMSLRLRIGALAVSAVTLFFLIVLTFPRLRRHREIQRVCILLAAFLPLSLFIVRTGYRPLPPSAYTEELPPPRPTAPRVLIIGIEGATLDQILPLAARGKLPWFDRLLRHGTHGRLVPFRPCVSPVMWESLFTGMLPYKHEILDTSLYRLPWGGDEIRVIPRGFGFRRLAVLSGMVEEQQQPAEAKSLTLTEILSRLGQPARWVGKGGGETLPSAKLSRDRLDRFLDPEGPTFPEMEELEDSLLWALQKDEAVLERGRSLWQDGQEQVLVLVLPGLDRVSQFFLRYAMPHGFGDVSREEIERYGLVLERYYRYLDDQVGWFLNQEGVEKIGGQQDTPSLVMVVSPFGVEPLPLGRILLRGLEGSRFESGYHGRAPDGMILAAGPGIRRGEPLGKASILDLVPTLLYFLGLPIGIDMDGHPLTRLFDDAVTSQNPVLLIPSYEASRIVTGWPPSEAPP